METNITIFFHQSRSQLIRRNSNIYRYQRARSLDTHLIYAQQNARWERVLVLVLSANVWLRALFEVCIVCGRDQRGSYSVRRQSNELEFNSMYFGTLCQQAVSCFHPIYVVYLVHHSIYMAASELNNIVFVLNLLTKVLLVMNLTQILNFKT